MADIRGSLNPRSFRRLLAWLLFQTLLTGGLCLALAAEAGRPDDLSSPPNPLTKRAKEQFTQKFAPDYAGRAKKGVFLRSLFALDPRAAAARNGGRDVASPFQDRADVERWGWNAELDWLPENEDENPFETPGFGNELDEAFNDPEHKVNWGKSGIAWYSHSMEYTGSDGQLKEPTEGSYSNVVNPQDGAFVFDMNYSPRSKNTATKKFPIPDLEFLSDISYFQWLQACEEKGVSPDRISLIFRARVSYKPTFDIIIKALKEAGRKKVPSWKDRATLTMSTIPGLAILGSTHGSGAAMFLIQHKAKLGLKRISEVVVWGSGSDGFEFGSEGKGEEGPYVHLRFTVEKV
ncbi:hypothetical protein C8034_v000486 [Colletotrichum sidae]|uniref:Uncharacterized protein n=1 Tax=Colletotrichum sidae TaxID=1347389 RepID=A0A4R8TGS2_9PEZI|nr:hypothetical protein C8034_v000486 [Colletotrichum sidae]